jgi:plasmid stability protein
MPTITVKNIPEDLYAELKRAAALNRRSVNSEIIVCIEKAVRSHRVSPGTVLAEARRLREQTAQYRISDDAFNQAKAAGRP